MLARFQQAASGSSAAIVPIRKPVAPPRPPATRKP